MQDAYGWAAFLASVTLLLVLGSEPAEANGRRPIYACFSPQNAAVIGSLGACDSSVRYGFESGACLALEPGVLVNDVERHGPLWRFRVFGAHPYLYAADWAAGFQNTAETGPPGFERYLPVTARLLASGRNLAECDEAWEKLAARFDDHERRWKEYQSWSRRKADGATAVVVIYVSDTGPKLAAEGQQLRRQADALDRRCASVAAIEADDDFMAFVRTARNV